MILLCKKVFFFIAALLKKLFTWQPENKNTHLENICVIIWQHVSSHNKGL